MYAKIKTWKQMENEFSSNGASNILCECFFSKSMEMRMPRNRVIEIKRDTKYFVWNVDGNYKYYISSDMIESSPIIYTIYGGYICM